jgi:class 3 adenylate cyclase
MRLHKCYYTYAVYQVYGEEYEGDGPVALFGHKQDAVAFAKEREAIYDGVRFIVSRFNHNNWEWT